MIAPSTKLAIINFMFKPIRELIKLNEKVKKVQKWKGHMNKGTTFKIEDGKGNKALAHYDFKTKQFFIKHGLTSINGEVNLEEIIEKYNPQFEDDMIFVDTLVLTDPLPLEYGEVKVWILPNAKKKKFYERR